MNSVDKSVELSRTMHDFDYFEFAAAVVESAFVCMLVIAAIAAVSYLA